MKSVDLWEEVVVRKRTAHLLIEKERIKPTAPVFKPMIDGLDKSLKEMDLNWLDESLVIDTTNTIIKYKKQNTNVF